MSMVHKHHMTEFGNAYLQNIHSTNVTWMEICLSRSNVDLITVKYLQLLNCNKCHSQNIILMDLNIIVYRLHGIFSKNGILCNQFHIEPFELGYCNL